MSIRSVPKRTNRDEFSPKTNLQIAKRAAWLCSYPPCRNPTVGATSDGDGEINIGTAAHICAAAPGGPRYDAAMTPEERSSAKNGIWLCRDHGKAVDSNDPEFTVERLREWKRLAEVESWRRVLRHEAPQAPAPTATDAQVAARMRAAAEADLSIFRRTAKWPATSVALTLDVDGFDAPVTTSALASAVTTLDDLILVAPPGMGKTTTLFQIAEGVLANGEGAPIVVPLGDWATEGVTIVASILNRPAFKGVSEDDFRIAAQRPGIVLLLDGWNELDAEARKRARLQVSTLKAQAPELGLIVSTRRQVLDIPFGGTRVDLLPLNEDQQKQIAISTRGEAGVRILDQAWRTPGVRELVTIPLYLVTLLSLPEGAPFPTTKEEVLRRFVSAHEKEVARAEQLRAVAQGFQQNYLEGLAVFAMRTSNSAISDSNARRSISETETSLFSDGQLTVRTQPAAMIDVLVDHHMLTRLGDAPGVSFQHQQFQEWYASHAVERRIMAELDNAGALATLKAELFNLPAFEEAILFAVERTSRSEAAAKAACAKAILAAFDVDPMLAAEMIYRSTDEVWFSIAAEIQERIARWHAPGTSDRAQRFMMNSARPEFLDRVWPLITDKNQQVSLKALRNCRRFRPPILGSDPVKRVRSLPQKPRLVLLYEIASHSGMDGLDLATEIAESDPDPEVQASVVDALAFPRADAHVARVLRGAKDATFDLVARKNLVDEVSDGEVSKGLAAARARQVKQGASPEDRLHVIVFATDGADRSAEVTAIISEMEIDKRQDRGARLIYEGLNRYSRAVAEGLLERVRSGRKLFYGADNILASAGFALEDDAIVEIAIAETQRYDDRAQAAASMLGPQAAGKLIDALYAIAPKLRDEAGKYDNAASDRYHDIKARLAHVPGASLVRAVQARSAQADVSQMALLADLLSRHHPDGETDRGRPFSAQNLADIRALIEDWGARMLADGGAERWEVARIATLASHAPDVSLLPLLKRLLDNNLTRYSAFRDQAAAAGWRHGKAVNGARQPMMHEYQRAFLAIDAPDTAALMREYLADPHFGELAAQVLAEHWRTANEPPPDRSMLGRVDFRRVEEKRAALDADPAATSEEAEAIFGVLEPLIADGATDEEKMLAVALGIVGAFLPHGQRGATLEQLIAITHRRARPKLLLNLILSGHVIDGQIVADGFAETLEAAKKETWILTQSEGYELREWLRLIPFTNRPAVALSLVRSIPDAHRHPRLLEEMVKGLAETPSKGGEEVLFKLAEDDPRFCGNYAWRNAVVKLGTASAARRLIDLTIGGALDVKSYDDWHWTQELGGLISQHADVRAHVYDLLKDGTTSKHLIQLARAVAETPDIDGLLLLIDLENKQKLSLLDWRAIQGIVTEDVPIENWRGAYNVVPVPAAELRQKLLAKTSDGGAGDAAARCLNLIDGIRDEHGLPISEPRHPDLASGKPWPIMAPDPDASPD